MKSAVGRDDSANFVWADDCLLSPFNGRPLRRDTAHSLTDGAERYPVIDEIPFLRTGRDELRRCALASLDAGNARGALAELLRDQDDWARTPPPSAGDVEALIDGEAKTLRDAMRRLNFAAVADYFAFRWSDPTFLSGLALLNAHLPPQASLVFELACGIGHFCREFELRGINVIGADVVFAKLYLARHYVAPSCRYICFDAAAPFPLDDELTDVSFCHDAFYFLPRKPHVADELRRVTRADGELIVGHAHNAAIDNFSSGTALDVAEYAALFPNAQLYDDDELTKALLDERPPRQARPEDLAFRAAAIAIVSRPNGEETRAIHSDKFTMPAPGTRLKLNPLLRVNDAGAVEAGSQPAFPSTRYGEEYAAVSEYLTPSETLTEEDARRVAQGGETGDDVRLRAAVRNRHFVALPERW